MKRRQLILGLAVGLLTLWLAGGTDTGSCRAAEVKAPPAAAKAAAKEPASGAIPRVTAPAVPRADSQRTVGKPDPFRPFIEANIEPRARAQGKAEAGKVRPLSPLQQKEIGQFRLVGIAGDDKKRTAVVEDRVAKKFYPLQVGTYIGLNEGRVTEILSDRVIVVEQIEEQEKKTKKTQTRRIVVMLHKEE